ncbi:MAG: hypothetical protein P8186_25995 [Anaerolineae bacterium]
MKRHVSLFLIASSLTLVAVIGALSRPEIATTRAMPHKPAAEASQVIKLASREITPDELTTLAPFEILWPQDLPDGYQLLHIMEMSESLTESSHSGIFYLEYITTGDQDKPLSGQSRLIVWERLKTTQTLPHLDGKQPVDTLRLADGTQIPIYTSEGGRAKRAFLERGQVNIELSFWGVPLEDVARIASSLAPN